MYETDEYGGKRKIASHKQVVSMAFERVELGAVDAMVSFNARTPAAWQQRWARNFQIKKSRLTSKVETEEPEMSERQAQKMIRQIKKDQLRSIRSESRQTISRSASNEKSAMSDKASLNTCNKLMRLQNLALR